MEKKNCSNCGNEFEYQKPHRGGLRPNSNAYCSSSCKWVAQRRRHPRRVAPIEPRDCIACGKNFVPPRFRTQRTCSVLCNAEVQKRNNRERNAERRPDEVNCEECQNVFVPRFINEKFCSRKCRVRRHSRLYREKHLDRIKEKNKIWWSNNREKYLQYQRNSKLPIEKAGGIR